MSTESNRQTSKSSPNPQSSDLKASDFFPPGEGWNRAEKPDGTHRDEEQPDDQRPLDRNH